MAGGKSCFVTAVDGVAKGESSAKTNKVRSVVLGLIKGEMAQMESSSDDCKTRNGNSLAPRGVSCVLKISI